MTTATATRPGHEAYETAIATLTSRYHANKAKGMTEGKAIGSFKRGVLKAFRARQATRLAAR